MRIISWQVKEMRWGNFSQYEVVMECEMLLDNRKFQISKIVLCDEEAQDFVTDVRYFMILANNANEKQKNIPF